MKGDAQPLIKFFDGSDKRFIIPLYQRNYDWKEENCEQLFQDLIETIIFAFIKTLIQLPLRSV